MKLGAASCGAVRSPQRRGAGGDVTWEGCRGRGRGGGPVRRCGETRPPGSGPLEEKAGPRAWPEGWRSVPFTTLFEQPGTWVFSPF